MFETIQSDTDDRTLEQVAVACRHVINARRWVASPERPVLLARRVNEDLQEATDILMARISPKMLLAWIDEIRRLRGELDETQTYLEEIKRGTQED